MAIELKTLEKDDAERFASEMQAAFQLAVDDAPESAPLPVLPRRDIDASLAHEGAEALVAWEDGEPVGGAIIFPDQETREHECALLYVAARAHGKGIGTRLWSAIEEHYPDAKAWRLCTPCCEQRNIHFYLRKCGFHIVDLFEDSTAGTDCPAEERDMMFSFLKRLDGRWG